MPIYEATASSLTAIPATSFAALGLKERVDLQPLLAAQIEALEDGLLVLAEEFGDWADSSRRIDLLCLDVDANLVVVELKRDDHGGHMELQALRYAAMISAMTFDQAVAALARYRSKAAPDLAAARAALLAHVGWTEPDEEAFAQETRIILAAADFGKEVTTTVIWLRERFEMDIRCVRLRPHRMDGGRLLLDIQPLIPLPETVEFQTQIGAKQAAERKERAERHDLRLAFLFGLIERLEGRSAPHRDRTPSPAGVLYGAIGKAGFSINYVVKRSVSRLELLIQSEDAKQQLRRLSEQRTLIEAKFGQPLDWNEKENARQCRVLVEIAGGYRSPKSEWPALQDKLIAQMERFDGVIRPRVAALP